MIYKEYTCVVCGKKFQASQPAKYCSPQCKKYVMNHRRAKFQCVVCGKIFEGNVNEKPRFCSNQCVSKCRQEILKDPNSPLSKYMTVKREKNEYTRVCVNCGKHFITHSASTINRQCPECLKTYSQRWAKEKKEWIEKSSRMTERELDAYLEAQNISVEVGAASPAIHEAQSPVKTVQTREEINARRRRVYAKKKALGMRPELGTGTKLRNTTLDDRGKVCEVCGYDYDEDALQVHHIDMDRSHNYDDNLIVLCSNCHSILHQRIKRHMQEYEDKLKGIINELDNLKAELKHRKKSGTPCEGQPDLKAVRDDSQGQRLPVEEDLLSTDTRPMHPTEDEKIV